MRDVELVPMREDQFSAYLEDSVARYARENIKAGYRTERDAVQKSREDHQRLLPSGTATPNNSLLVVRDRATGRDIGVVWFRTEGGERPIAFIYDIYLEEGWRGKGFGRATMKELERLARGMGIKGLYLHVFAHNPVAIHLYETSGFKAKSLNMEKLLD